MVDSPPISLLHETATSNECLRELPFDAPKQSVMGAGEGGGEGGKEPKSALDKALRPLYGLIWALAPPSLLPPFQAP